VQLPHTYKEGRNVYAHIHWTPRDRGIAEGGKSVGWKVDISWANMEAVFPSSPTYDLTDITTGTDDLHEMTPDVVISGTGKLISSMLTIRIYRDGGTWAGVTAAQSPALLEFDMHIPINTLGSRQILIK
jgi:hypothetical protein